MVEASPLDRAAIALKAYEQWRDDINGGTTINEDRLAEALWAVIAERNGFEEALLSVRGTLESGFGHRRTMSEGTSVRHAMQEITDALGSY